MEGKHCEYTVGIKVFWELFEQFRNRDGFFEILDWTITDFDNFLEGNPLVPTHPDNFREL